MRKLFRRLLLEFLEKVQLFGLGGGGVMVADEIRGGTQDPFEG